MPCSGAANGHPDTSCFFIRQELRYACSLALLALLEGGEAHSRSVLLDMLRLLPPEELRGTLLCMLRQLKEGHDSTRAATRLFILMCQLGEAAVSAGNQQAAALLLDLPSDARWLQRSIGHVEILNSRQELARVYFPIPEVTRYLTEETKLNFLESVPRHSLPAKLQGLLDASADLQAEMDHQAFLSRRGSLAAGLLALCASCHITTASVPLLPSAPAPGTQIGRSSSCCFCSPSCRTHCSSRTTGICPSKWIPSKLAFPQLSTRDRWV